VQPSARIAIEDHQRLVHVHLQVAARTAEADGYVVRHDLHGDHRERLALGRVDLAGHDRRAGLVLRNRQLGEPRARTARDQPDVVGDLVERHSERAQGAGQLHQRVVSAQDGELVGGADEREAGQPGDLGGGSLGESRRRIDPRADGSAAEREAVHSLERRFDPLEIVGEHRRVAGPLLPQGERRRVLHVSAADLHHVLPGVRLRGNGSAEPPDGGNQPLLHGDGSRDVHRRRKRVVRRLRHVDVIVGVDRCLAAEGRRGELAAAVGDHLVHVHVELRAAAAHPDVQREHVVVLALEDFVTAPHDE